MHALLQPTTLLPCKQGSGSCLHALHVPQQQQQQQICCGIPTGRAHRNSRRGAAPLLLPPLLLAANQCGVQHFASPVAVAAKAPRAGGSSSSNGGRRQRGFAPAKQKRAEKREEQLVKEIEGEQQGVGPGVDAIQMRSEYQLYKDAEYKPQRWIGPVDVQSVPGRGRGLVLTEDVVPGDLLMVLPALAFLEGEQGEVPEPEELHVAMLEDGLSPGQRRILDVLYDGTEESMTTPVSLTTLDLKFWSARGKSDSQAPQISSSRLLSILQNCACADAQQDGACMMLRHQKPFSYVGLWPELSLVNHSSCPNISFTVVKDRLLVHAATEMSAGDELLRSYLGASTTRPLAEREAEMAEAGWPGIEASSVRGVLETQASENVQGVLQDAWQWYSQEALLRFNEANEAEDLEPLKELLEEAEQIVSEVEEVIEDEPGLDDLQKTLLKASAYDSYDMLVLTDEFVNQERASPRYLLFCLELLRVLAPGSESHTSVAFKYEMMMRDRLQMSETLLKKSQSPSKRQEAASIMKACAKESEYANEYCLDAYLTRYGWVNLEMYESLRQGTEVYTEAVEQMSLMEAQGLNETSKDYSINGVNVSVVDKVDLGGANASPSAGLMSSQQAVAESSRGGASLQVVQAPVVEEDEDEEEISFDNSFDIKEVSETEVLPPDSEDDDVIEADYDIGEVVETNVLADEDDSFLQRELEMGERDEVDGWMDDLDR